MLSINTNLSSLITQRSMKSATNLLNQAVERMSTGYKVNHAKDNAAAYSIITNMDTKINAYQVAEDNVAMGMDLVTTAMDMVANMQEKGTRLRDLSIQARNGSYGVQSLAAINSEAAALMAEINRIYSIADYNGISLFSRTEYQIASHLPKAGESGFIDDSVAIDSPKPKYGKFIENPVTYTDQELDAMLASGDIIALDNNVTSFTSGKKYLISDKSELERLATLVNSGKSGDGAIFILGKDIDLNNQEWTPVGNSSNMFKGSFDGNGHAIKNLKIDSTEDYRGFFGFVQSTSEIKNLGIEGGSVKGGDYVGGLVGYGGRITNCYSTCDVNSGGYGVGGLVGYANASISNSYATGNIIGGLSYVGGLVGYIKDASITNSYATGNVISPLDAQMSIGGFAGYVENSTITGCYATGDVSGGYTTVGGFIGELWSSTVTNSYATGNVTATDDCWSAGGFIAFAGDSTVTNCFSTGNVFAGTSTGGLVGCMQDASITNCYATGNVVGKDMDVGGLLGDSISTTISNCYATGTVSGTENVGGLVGYDYTDTTINNCYATGSIAGTSNVGGLVGRLNKTAGTTTITDSASYSKVTGNDAQSTGSLIGGAALTSDGVNFGTLDIANTEALPQEMNAIGNVFRSNGTVVVYDMTTMLASIKDVAVSDISTTLQVGVNANSTSRLNFNTNFSFDLSAISTDIKSDKSLSAIDAFLAQLNEQETTLGAMQNRLDSALDEISTQYENLVSSRSTLRDADIAEVSSQYIQQQILQQASATLMATANQMPSIALQLI